MELNHSHWISCRGLETLGSDQKPDSRISLGYIYMEEGKARAIFVVGRYMEIRKRRTAAPANKEKRQNSSDYKRLRININLHGLEILGVILILRRESVEKLWGFEDLENTSRDVSIFINPEHVHPITSKSIRFLWRSTFIFRETSIFHN